LLWLSKVPLPPRLWPHPKTSAELIAVFVLALIRTRSPADSATRCIAHPPRLRRGLYDGQERIEGQRTRVVLIARFGAVAADAFVLIRPGGTAAYAVEFDLPRTLIAEARVGLC